MNASQPDVIASHLPIKARLTAMSERTRALLEYHFDHDGQRVFTVASSVDTPDIVIVDYDYPGARAGIVDGRWQAVTPLMVLAHGEPELEAPVTVVSKPLDRARLDAAALRLLNPAERLPEPSSTAKSMPAGATLDRDRSAPSAPPSTPHIGEASIAAARGNTSSIEVPAEASGEGGGAPRRRRFDDDGSITLDDTDVGAADAGRRASPADRLAPATAAGRGAVELQEGHHGLSANGALTEIVAAAADDLARREARLSMLCGPARTLDDVVSADDPEHRYHPRRHVGAHLRRALDGLGPGTVAVSLTFDGMELHALSWVHRVFSTVSLERAGNVERLFGAFGEEEVTVTSCRRGAVNALVDRVNRDARHAFSFEAFTWLAALFSARGRLPAGLDAERPCLLRHWPNLTRLERIPHDVHIAAAWSRRPASIVTVTRSLGCEPRFVTAFHAGAVALGLIDFDNLPNGDPDEDHGRTSAGTAGKADG